MDLHAWITQQVEHVERMIDENEFPLSQTDGVHLRCEGDRRILARHRLDPSETWAPCCEGCGRSGDMDMSAVDNLNECPELLDLGHAHGLTDDILAGLDQPQPPEPKPSTGPRFGLADILATPPITTSDVPEALRGTRWKP